jgi:hypothetical protein
MRYASPVRWEGQSLLCPYPYRAPKDPTRRVRYDRAQLIPEVFFVGSASHRTTPIVAWHQCPMMFELLFDLLDRLLNT